MAARRMGVNISQGFGVKPKILAEFLPESLVKLWL
jgi:hypothetical protein